MNKTLTFLVGLLATVAVQAQTDYFTPYQQTKLRMPSVPLISNDPYISFWSPYNKLTGGTTRHWTGAVKAMDGLLRVDGMEGDTCNAGQDIHVTLSLDPGVMKREEILVQLVVGPWDGNNFTETPDITPLSYERTTSDQSMVFSCNYQPRHNGSHAYGVRVIPMIPELASYLDSHLVVWA